MNFSSIKEYFYKTYSYCFLIMLMPLSFIVMIYYQFITLEIQPFANASGLATRWLLIFFSTCIVILTTVHLFTRAWLKRISKQVGLGNKLDRYFYVTLVRSIGGAFTCFVMTGGYLLSRNEFMNVFFLLSLGWICFQLPTSRKVCQELRLKGDELDMVLHKKDKF